MQPFSQGACSAHLIPKHEGGVALKRVLVYRLRSRVYFNAHDAASCYTGHAVRRAAVVLFQLQGIQCMTHSRRTHTLLAKPSCRSTYHTA
jgi:hypothetical protein